MAVRNAYVNTNVAAGKKVNSAFNEGQPEITMICTFETLAADDAGSIYRLFKNLPADLIPVDIKIMCDAIAGATDIDLGFYESLEVGGAVIDKDVLCDGADIAAGQARGSEENGLQTVGVEKVQQNIAELCGHTLTTRKAGYDLVLTANSEITAAGTISVIAKFVQG